VSDHLDYPEPSYRARRPPSAGLDPDVKRMAMVAGGLATALAVGVGGWSILGHHGQGVPVIEAESGPMRVKPENRGGMQIAGADEQVLGGTSNAKEALAPLPETPELQALHAQIAAAAKQEQVNQAEAAPEPLSAPGAQAATDQEAATPADASDEEDAAPRAVEKPAAHKHAASPYEAAHETAAAHRPAPHRAGDSGPSDESASSERPRPAATASAPAAEVGAHAGGVQVQLAALTSQQGAQATWERLAHRMPDLLGGKHPVVQRVERDGHVFFRLRTGGFADLSEAAAFCERVRAKGSGCSVASF
jgi:SPOR domain